MRKNARWTIFLMAVLLIAAGCSRGPSDTAITTDIKAKMFSSTVLKESNLRVTVKDGEATLSGAVVSDAARLEAYKLAQETAGVKKVNDQMTVQMAQAQPALQPEPAPRPTRPAPKRAAPRSITPVKQVEPPPPAPAPVPVEQAAQPVVQPVAQTTSAPPPPPEPQPKKVEIPAGTSVGIRMIDSIDSKVNKSGEVFRASLDGPIQVDGEDVVPDGADVWVKLAEAKSAGTMTGRSELQLSLVKLQFQGRTYNLVSSTYAQKGSSTGVSTAKKVGAGAAIGAVIGGIAGGGKGAAIGAAAGGGIGAGAQVLTKGQQIRVPSETRLDFRLEAPVTVTVMPGGNGRR